MVVELACLLSAMADGPGFLVIVAPPEDLIHRLKSRHGPNGIPTEALSIHVKGTHIEIPAAR